MVNVDKFDIASHQNIKLSGINFSIFTTSYFQNKEKVIIHFSL